MQRFDWIGTTCAFAAAVAATVAFSATPAHAQGKAAWDGVYTDAQAARGKAVYEKSCQSCHAAAGAGGFGITYSGTALKGQKFLQAWDDDLATLFRYAGSPPPGSTLGQFDQRHGDSDTPRGSKDPLTEADYVDVIAYIFQLNGLPAGTTELKASDMLTVRFGEKERQPLPNFSLAQTVGCLTQAPDKTWTLTSATLRRARNGEPSKPSELKAVDGKPLGTLTLALKDVYPDPDTVITPDEHAGHKVQAKGIYMKEAKGDQINVNALEMVSATCK